MLPSSKKEVHWLANTLLLFEQHHEQERERGRSEVENNIFDATTHVQSSTTRHVVQ